MRIVIDLQACQTPTSRNRGIGRYSMPLAQEIARQSTGKHDVWLALNGCFPETIGDIRDRFRELMPPERIVTFPLPPQPVRYTGGWPNHAAEAIREHFLANLAPDIVHVSSLFEGQNTEAVTTIGRIPNAVTIYDLIPLLHKDEYLAAPDVRCWYFSKIEHLRKAQLWLTISDHTREEAIAALDLPRDRVVTISSAVDDRFTPLTITETQERKLRDRYGLVRPFLMYTGGIDFHKNVEALIEAFAMLPACRDYQLAIVCSLNDQGRQILMAHAAKVGLDPAEMVVTGFVPEDDLVTLYNLCHLFVFPSLHEGFGLPVLEAMACGAPVIGSNSSSIPEVIGWNDALFDPGRPSAIAEAIARVLADEGFRQKLRDHGIRRARLFSWEEAGRRAMTAFEQLEKPMTRASMMEQNQAPIGFVAELVAAREALEAELRTLRDRFDWLKETAQQHAAAAAQREQELAITNAGLHNTNSRLQNTNAGLHNTNARLQNIADSQAIELQSIYASRSWWLTKPLRWIANLRQQRISSRVGTE